MADRTPASPAPVVEPPYGIAGVAFEPGLTPQEMAERLAALPDDVSGLPRRDVAFDAAGATIVYVLEEDPNAPRFGVVVAVRVEATADADALVAGLEQDRWGDPAGHDLSAAGDGAEGGPAFREFSRSFPPTQFALPFRPVFFLIWYRAGDDFAFMVVADSPAVLEALTGAVAATLR